MDALTDNFVHTEYRDFACPIFVTVWAQKAAWAFTTYNNEPTQKCGPNFFLRGGWTGGCYVVGVYSALQTRLKRDGVLFDGVDGIQLDGAQLHTFISNSQHTVKACITMAQFF